MESFISFADTHHREIRAKRVETENAVKKAIAFPIEWVNDSTKFSEIVFKGYEAGKKPSEISGLPRLYYDRNKPFDKPVKFYNVYNPFRFIQKPKAYIIPQGWWEVIDRLKANKVNMVRLNHDSTMAVDVYRIEDYKTSTRPYEKHYPHSSIGLSTSKKSMRFRKGDYLVPMNQVANRFITEVLEPQSNDSYFAWNFFDAILTQKEGFSDYVFEDTGADYLKAHPELRTALEEKIQKDTLFAKSPESALDFVFKHSPYYEPEHLRYPVYRIMN
jgi:hypothetical protein